MVDLWFFRIRTEIDAERHQELILQVPTLAFVVNGCNPENVELQVLRNIVFILQWLVEKQWYLLLSIFENTFDGFFFFNFV